MGERWAGGGSVVTVSQGASVSPRGIERVVGGGRVAGWVGCAWGGWVCGGQGLMGWVTSGWRRVLCQAWQIRKDKLKPKKEAHGDLGRG